MAEQSNLRSIPTVRVTFTELEQIYRQTERKSKSAAKETMRAGNAPRGFGGTSASPLYTQPRNLAKEVRAPRPKRPDKPIYTPPGRARCKEDGGAPSPEPPFGSPAEAPIRVDGPLRRRTVSSQSVTSEPSRQEESWPMPDVDASGNQEAPAGQHRLGTAQDIPESFNTMEFVNSSLGQYPPEAPLDVTKGLVVWNSGMGSPSLPNDAPEDAPKEDSLASAQSPITESYPAFSSHAAGPRERVKGRGRLRRPDGTQVGASKQAPTLTELTSHVENLSIRAAAEHAGFTKADAVDQFEDTGVEGITVSEESVQIQETERIVSVEPTRNEEDDAKETAVPAFRPIIDWAAEVEKSEQEAQNDSTEEECEDQTSPLPAIRGSGRRRERRSGHRPTRSSRARAARETASQQDPRKSNQERKGPREERKSLREERKNPPEERRSQRDERKSHPEERSGQRDERRNQREERKGHPEERRGPREERKRHTEERKGQKEEREGLREEQRSRLEERTGYQKEQKSLHKEQKNFQEERRSGGKEHGLLHVPKYEMVAKGKAEGESDPTRRQLYDPENPERPLCVVSPASHTASPSQEIPPRQRAYGGPEGGTPPYPHHLPQQYRPGPNFIPGYNFPAHMHSPRGPMFFSGMGPPHIPMEMARHSSPMMPPNMYKFSATEKNVQEALILEQDLNVLLSHTFNSADLKKLGQCRWKIQLRYENTILSDMEFCAKHNIEQTLWRAAFYQVIESFRRQMVEAPALREDIHRALISLIEEGSVFYENLLEKLQDTYQFPLNDFFDSNALRPQTLSRTVVLALLSAQKVTICLGDLARYREQANEGSNYGRARSWYLKAQQLAPKNGRPYNQLAILAVYARRKLDAVYYYMRSLAASNPFQTAKEGLISIFDDARKKYEQLEKSREGPKLRPSQRNPPRNRGVRYPHGFIEVWYALDGHVAKDGIIQKDGDEDLANEEDGDELDIGNLPTVELNKRFSLSFLHVHGKLYNRVGMETFSEACVKMLREFRLLLCTQPLPFNFSRLLQIVTINMFAVFNSGPKDSEPIVEPQCQPVLQGRALEVGVEMFRLLVERCVELIRELPSQRLAFTEDLQQLLPAIKVWCDWFMCHLTIWNPLPSLTNLGDGAEKQDVWTKLAQLLNLFREHGAETSLLASVRHEGYEPVVLPEDITLAGFVPLLWHVQETMFAKKSYDKDLVRNLFRVARIQLCGDFLCGLHAPVLEFSVERNEYVPIAAAPLEKPAKVERRIDDSSQSDAVQSPGERPTDYDFELGGNPESLSLRTRKQQLERAVAHQEQEHRQIQAVLQEVSQLGNVRFEVRPKWLVPDTNCFIDHLSHITTLVLSSFQLAIPLIVINELEGLARGGPADRSSSRSSMVSQDATAALTYIEECFKHKNPQVRAITSKGSLLTSIRCRSEDSGEHPGTNDDLILTCCEKLNEDISAMEPQRPKEGVTVISRSVVLLTDDRNLRVKAHAHEMPVKDIQRFMSLMNVR